MTPNYVKQTLKAQCIQYCEKHLHLETSLAESWSNQITSGPSSLIKETYFMGRDDDITFDISFPATKDLEGMPYENLPTIKKIAYKVCNYLIRCMKIFTSD